jgi:hypothetical protein
MPKRPIVPAKPLADSKDWMIPGVGQLREVEIHSPTGNLAVPGDDGCPIARWDFDCLKDLGLPLAAELSLACARRLRTHSNSP